ncbi:MAG: elongation factor 1-beta [Nitrososphaerota archaeon]|nr:elongation factor 1-beta [Candidatus Geocrenenecus dongiae]
MAKVFMIVRIMPTDEDVDLEELVSKIKSSLPENIEVSSTKIEPFAYGLNVLNVVFKMPDEEGYPAKLEEYLKSFEEISEFEIVGLSRT